VGFASVPSEQLQTVQTSSRGLEVKSGIFPCRTKERTSTLLKRGAEILGRLPPLLAPQQGSDIAYCPPLGLSVGVSHIQQIKLSI
jgi:hypothetical protein